MGLGAELNKQRGGPGADKFLGWTAAISIALLLILLVAFSAGSDDNGGGDNDDGACAAVYEKHLQNAREFGYPPDERADFIADCEQGRAEIDDAINP